jgi:hypothetical protein
LSALPKALGKKFLSEVGIVPSNGYIEDMKLLPKFPCYHANIDELKNIVVLGVESAVIETLCFLDMSNVLAVTYKSGRTYHYTGVEFSTIAKMLDSDSAGKFLNAVIKPNHEFYEVPA